MDRIHVKPNNNFPDSSQNGNVAVLRDVLQSQLELKMPSGYNREKFAKQDWTKHGRCYEPKDNLFGRVLDGPVSPDKYFQGVPPPSFNQVTRDSKPPAPPSKLAAINNPNLPTSSRLPSYARLNHKGLPDAMPDSRLFMDELDDGASVISSCISTFGESSEIAGFSAAAEQRDMYEQYKKKLLETMLESEREELNSELPPNLFANVSLTPFGHSDIPSGNLDELNFKKRVHSLDLESSEMLVKPKTPVPYSSKTIEHYGTIRKKHRPIENIGNIRNTINDIQSQNIRSAQENGFIKIENTTKRPENEERLNSTLETAFKALATINNIKSDVNLKSSNSSLSINQVEHPTEAYIETSQKQLKQEIFERENDMENDNYFQKIKSEMSDTTGLINITKKLDETTRDLSLYLKFLDDSWSRSKSQPLIVLNDDNSLGRSKEIIKNVYLDEGNLTNESHFDLSKTAQRKISSSLGEKDQQSVTRSSPNEFKTTPEITATVIFSFQPTSFRELSLRRGDTLKIIRHLDENWLEGEKDGKCGIFPSSYVRLNNGTMSGVQQLRAKYSCNGRNGAELSFEKGDVIGKIRIIDSNWIEGMNKFGDIGLIPSCYFEVVPTGQLNKSEPLANNEEFALNKNSVSHNKSVNPESFSNVKDVCYNQNISRHIPEEEEIYRVVYSYHPEKNDELQLLTDDIVFVVERCDDGWFIGTSLRTGKFGIFPGNYVTKHFL